MNKNKFYKKKNQSFFLLKGEKGQQLTDREIYKINSNEVFGLVNVDVVRKGATFQLIYNLTGLVSLREYLISPLNKAIFSNLISDILNTYDLLQKNVFNLQNVLLDIEHVMVNPATRKIYFMYVPIQFFQNNLSNQKEFFLSIVQHCSFEMGEDNSYVSDYINVLNRGMNFSYFELREYVNSLMGNGKNIIVCPKCASSIEEGNTFCPKCGAKLIKEKLSRKVYDPFANSNRSETNGKIRNRDVDSLDVSKEQEFGGTQGFSSSSNDLNRQAPMDMPYIEGTTVLNSFNPQQAPNVLTSSAFIIRTNGEKIVINKPYFVVGKVGGNADYEIQGNSTISRKHIAITTKHGMYYLQDLKSTNKTYLNGHVLVPEVEMELKSGDDIRISNEALTFYIG